MKKETTPKKAWKKPEVQDLDVKNTASGFIAFSYEDVLPFNTFYPSGS